MKSNIEAILSTVAFLGIVIIVGLLWGDFGVNALFVALGAYVIGAIVGWRRGYNQGVIDTHKRYSE